MTMQVTMIGSDGIILASDTKWYTDSFDPRYAEIRDEHGGSKILISPTKTLAVSRAGDMIKADEVARTIISGWDPAIDDDPDNPNLGKLVAPFVGRQFECLAASIQATPKIVRVTCPQDSPIPHVTPALDRLCAGDQGNPAKFWHLRYYDRTRPIDELMALAAQLIVDAAHLNSGSIGGLEIVFSDHGIFKRLPESKCTVLESEALTRSEKIKKLTFPRP